MMVASPCLTFFLLNHDAKRGSQSSPDDDMYTMPFLQKREIMAYSPLTLGHTVRPYRTDMLYRLQTCVQFVQPPPALPHGTYLDTVAGEALSTFCGSKMSLQLTIMGNLSPLAKVRVLLSSSTELRFSIQSGSTGPSKTSQICSPFLSLRDFLHKAEKIPSVQSFVATSRRPNIWPEVMA